MYMYLNPIAALIKTKNDINLIITNEQTIYEIKREVLRGSI